MILKNIDEKTLDEFVYNSSKAHFMQTSAWAKVSKQRNYIPHLLGIYDNDELKATSMLLEKKIGPFSTFYCPRGPILDYSNLVLLKEVVITLKEYVKNNKGLYLKIDPDIILSKLDKNAKPIETFDQNKELIDYLINLGFKHRGFTTKFNQSSNPRFTFRVDVSKEENELLESFHSTTKNILKRNNPYNLSIRKGSIDDVKNFYKTMSETAKRKKMYLEPEQFFTDFYTILNKQDMSDIFVVEAELKKVLEAYNLKQKELDQAYEDLKKYSPKKQEGLRKELDNVQAKLNKELDILNNTKEDKLVLSSMITAKFKDKVWTVHGGNSDDLMFLNANYEMYYEILKDASRQGYNYVDFFGSEGEVNKESSIYGIYLFKLRFGGDFDEFIGEFDLITRPLMNSIIQKLLIARRRFLINKSTK